MDETRRTVVVTGAAGVVGRAVVCEFLRQNDCVVAVSRSEQSLHELRGEIRNRGIDETHLRDCAVDLLRQGAVIAVVDAVDSQTDGDVVLVNGARDRRSLVLRDGSEGIRDAFMSEYELGVVVPYLLSLGLSQRFTTRLKAVVNIGSQYGLVAQNRSLYGNYLAESVPQYGATKAALFQLTRDLSVRLGVFGTRVNAVALGGVRGRVDAEFEERYAEMLPLGRMLEPADVAGPVVFLASESAVAVTGHTLAATGGWEAI